jgi:hypothetical protein
MDLFHNNFLRASGLRVIVSWRAWRFIGQRDRNYPDQVARCAVRPDLLHRQVGSGPFGFLIAESIRVRIWTFFLRTGSLPRLWCSRRKPLRRKILQRRQACDEWKKFAPFDHSCCCCSCSWLGYCLGRCVMRRRTGRDCYVPNTQSHTEPNTPFNSTQRRGSPLPGSIVFRSNFSVHPPR